MRNQILNNLNEQTKIALSSVQNLNKLAVANVEKLSEIGAANLRVYADLGLSQLNEVLEIKDLDGAKSFATRQSAVLKNLGEMAAADVRTLVQMGVDYNTAARQLVQEGLARILPKAA